LAFGLEGYRVLVTASTRGLGRAIAEVFLREGAVVTINGRYQDDVESAAKELSALGRAYGVAADIREAGEVSKLVEEAAKLMGGLDVVVHVAGPPRRASFEKLGLDAWEDVIKVVLKSAIFVAYFSLEHLKKSPNPSMVFCTGSPVPMAMEGIVASSSLRLAVHGLVRSLAKELGKYGIRVNAVVPGYVETRTMANYVKEEAEARRVAESEVKAELLKLVPLGRFGRPEEVAHVVAFLASKYASYVTGEVVAVDGGLLPSFGF